MSNLIEELKKEHAVIVDTLNKVKKLGITSDEGKNILLDAKIGLLEHLKKEDEQLYPLLNNEAENDANLKLTLDKFQKDMNEVSKAALEFFDRYSAGGSGVEFAKDFGRLFARLSQRIRREESTIFQKYDGIK